MLTAEQIEKIKTNIKTMQTIANTTKDNKERYYYYGQIDGIIGLLEMLEINIYD